MLSSPQEKTRNGTIPPDNTTFFGKHFSFVHTELVQTCKTTKSTEKDNLLLFLPSNQAHKIRETPELKFNSTWPNSKDLPTMPSFALFMFKTSSAHHTKTFSKSTHVSSLSSKTKRKLSNKSPQKLRKYPPPSFALLPVTLITNLS